MNTIWRLMKARYGLPWVLFVLLAEARSGEFKNLRFSEPEAPLPTPERSYLSAPAEQVFAGWQVFKNDQPYNGVTHYAYEVGEPLELVENDIFDRYSPTAYPFTPQLMAGAQDRKSTRLNSSHT